MEKEKKYKTRSLLRYDCSITGKEEPQQIRQDLINAGYDVNKIEILDREIFSMGKLALVDVKIGYVPRPDYVKELMPLWQFKD